MAVAKAGPVVSDNGNFIIDAPFGEEFMKYPLEVSQPERWLFHSAVANQPAALFSSTYMNKIPIHSS